MTHVKPVRLSDRDRGEVCIRSSNGSERFYERAVYTVEQAGEVLGLKRSAAFKAAKDGRLPTVDLPGGQRVTASALDRLLYPDDWPDVPEPEPEQPELTGEVEAAPTTWPTSEQPTADEVALAKVHEAHVEKCSLLQYDRRPQPRRELVERERIPEVETLHGPLGGGVIQPDGESEPYREHEEAGTTTPSGAWVGHVIRYGEV